jgi:hypothetical protein
MNSWEKSDSYETCWHDLETDKYELITEIGPEDFKSAMNLAKGGPVHGKFKRMIKVYMDITAPLYWWKEFDTYKIGTNCNSCSTMHKIHAKEFEMSDFSTEHLLDAYWEYDTLEEGHTSSTFLFNQIIDSLNHYRELFVAVKKRLKDNNYGGNNELRARDSKHMKQYWWQMIQLLPTSYNQRRTIEVNYEVLTSMHRDRKGHKLDEWHTFCDLVDTLPNNEFILVEQTYV